MYVSRTNDVLLDFPFEHLKIFCFTTSYGERKHQNVKLHSKKIKHLKIRNCNMIDLYTKSIEYANVEICNIDYNSFQIRKVKYIIQTMTYNFILKM